jgi:hypothetical protein
MAERTRLLIDLDPGPLVLARRRAAEGLRQLVQLVAMSDLSEEELDAVSVHVDEVMAGLAGHEPLSRYVHHSSQALQEAGVPMPAQESEIIFGPSSPIATPLAAYREADGRVTGEATFPFTYEGPPGSVHGGMVAAAFDALLGMAAATSGHPSMTGTMTVKYRSPTPLNRPIRFEAWFDRSEGRKAWTKATAFDGETLCAEAEGVFIEVRQEHFAQNAEG